MSKPPPDRPVSGWLMMLLGWALAFFTLSWLYHILISDHRERLAQEYAEGRAGELSVMAMHNGSLVLQENADGHYLAEGRINGALVTMLIDTGATNVALPEEIAKRAGLRKKKRGEVGTAGGKTTAWSTDIQRLQIGGILFHHLDGVILARMQEPVVLLGMNALGQLHITQSGGELVLSAPKQKAVVEVAEGRGQ